MNNLFSRSQVRFLILIVFMLVFIFLGKFFSVDREAINKFLRQVPIGYSALAFVFFYIAGTFVIWYLKDPLKIVGAVAFGPYLSTLLIYIAEIANAYIFFYISKLLGKDFVEKSLKGKFRKFYEKLENINLGWVFLMRAIPLIPYRVLDISFGLSKLPFRKYILVVLLASLPRIFWIQFILAHVKTFSIGEISLYFSQNRLVYILSFVYSIVAFAAIIKIKRRLQ